MTIQMKRLYYENSYLTTFESTIVKMARSDSSLTVELDKTAFYPTSGGQPHDKGYINGIPVIDVTVNEQGQVIHQLQWEESTPPTLTVGEVVTGEIDWLRRHDHMQHHTGQHILSACFEQVFDTDTIGFHLGTEDVTIDLDRESISTSEIEAVEEKANDMIAANLPVLARFIDAADLYRFQLRRPPKVSRDIRIVSIGEFDDNACGGTHVQNTAEIGMLKILKTERMKRGLRIHFLCGKRAFKHYQREHRVLSQLGKTLSAGTLELTSAVESLQKDLKTIKKNEKLLRKEITQLHGSETAEKASLYRPGLVCSVADIKGPYQAGDAKSIAASALDAMKRSTSSQPPVSLVAAVIVQDGQRAYISVVSSSPQEVVDEVDCNAILRRTLAPFDGKGGGGRESAQGFIQGTPQLPLDEIVKHLETVLSEC